MFYLHFSVLEQFWFSFEKKHAPINSQNFKSIHLEDGTEAN